VNEAITQMDQSTQQNAALVEEAAAAAASMQEQSAHLEQMVSHFRLAEAGAPALPASPAGTRHAPSAARRISSAVATN
jgi:methyl-accepting chemotaxis protein